MNKISKNITNFLIIWYNILTKQSSFNLFVEDIYIMIHNMNNFDHKYKIM